MLYLWVSLNKKYFRWVTQTQNTLAVGDAKEEWRNLDTFYVPGCYCRQFSCKTKTLRNAIFGPGYPSQYVHNYTYIYTRIDIYCANVSSGCVCKRGTHNEDAYFNDTRATYTSHWHSDYRRGPEDEAKIVQGRMFRPDTHMPCGPTGIWKLEVIDCVSFDSLSIDITYFSPFGEWRRGVSIPSPIPHRSYLSFLKNKIEEKYIAYSKRIGFLDGREIYQKQLDLLSTPPDTASCTCFFSFFLSFLSSSLLSFFSFLVLSYTTRSSFFLSFFELHNPISKPPEFYCPKCLYVLYVLSRHTCTFTLLLKAAYAWSWGFFLLSVCSQQMLILTFKMMSDSFANYTN